MKHREGRRSGRGLLVLWMVAIATVLGLLSEVRLLDAQQQNNTWSSLICIQGVRAYGEYKDDAGQMHFVDMEWDPAESDWTLTEGGNHMTGGFGPAGQHAHFMYFWRMEHQWSVSNENGEQEGEDDDWDLHWEHTHLLSNNLYTGACGFNDQ